MLKNLKTKANELGSLMVEAIAMLALISLVTPIIYKKASERTTELQDINASTEMRSLVESLDAYLKDNFYDIVDGDTVTRNSTNDKQVNYSSFASGNGAIAIPLNHIEEYLPYGFLAARAAGGDKIFDNPQLVVRKEDHGTSRKTLTGFIVAVPKLGADFPVMRASRIASMIGSNGGYANTDLEDNQFKVSGVQGIWEIENPSGELAGLTIPENTIVASSINAIALGESNLQENVLYRKNLNDVALNTMETTLYMGGYSIDNINKLIINRDGATDATNGKDSNNFGTITENNKDSLVIATGGATIAGRLQAVGKRLVVADNTLSYKSNAGNGNESTLEITGTQTTLTSPDKISLTQGSLSGTGGSVDIGMTGGTRSTRHTRISDTDRVELHSNNEVNLYSKLVRGIADSELFMGVGTASITDLTTPLTDLESYLQMNSQGTTLQDKNQINILGPNNPGTTAAGIGGQYMTMSKVTGTSGGTTLRDTNDIHVFAKNNLRLGENTTGSTALVSTYATDVTTTAGETISMSAGSKTTHYPASVGGIDMFADDSITISKGDYDGNYNSHGVLKMTTATGTELIDNNTIQVLAANGLEVRSGRNLNIIATGSKGGNDNGNINIGALNEVKIGNFTNGSTLHDYSSTNAIVTVNMTEGDPVNSDYGGEIKIRQGVIEIPRHALEEKNKTAPKGYIQADRFVSNANLDPNALPKDTGPKTPTPYEEYQVNPAYTSVMKDIKLVTRGGARLSDILPDFINKGIYVVDNTYNETAAMWTAGGFDPFASHTGCGIEASCATSAWLGFVPTPICPPGYAKVITINPAGFAVAQAGIPIEETPNKWDIIEYRLPQTVNSATPTSPLYFQKNTWLKAQVRSYQPGGTHKGWNAIMGFIYPYKYYENWIGELDVNSKDKEQGASSDTKIIWNLFPVYNRSLEAYATVYCYFDRNDAVPSSDPSVQFPNYTNTYVDKYDQISNPRYGYDGTSKTNYGELDDPNLKFKSPW